jgi:hypothetical protein
MAGSPPDRFEVLRSLIDAAARLARELSDDPRLERLLAVFARIPENDRDTILAVLEREAQRRIVTQDIAENFLQVELRANPNAQLYFRVIEPERKNEVEMLVFLRGLYNIRRGIDTLGPEWRAPILAALREMEPAERAKIDAFNAEMRSLLDECARSTTPGADTSTADPPVAPAINDVPSRRR